MSGPRATSSTEEAADEVAGHLLRIGAVTLSPRELYTWSSGVRSPVYCDNRRTLSYPEVRDSIVAAWSQLILTRCPDVQVLAGVATAGIPHAALLADRLHLPMVYVRPEPKGHGLTRGIEGALTSGARVVVVEDLISTASSLLGATRQLRAAGAKVIAASAIVTYGFPQAAEQMQKAELPWFTLTDLDHLKRKARAMGTLSDAELQLIDQGMADVGAQIARRMAAPTEPVAEGSPEGAARVPGKA